MNKRHITAGFFICLFISLCFSAQVLANHGVEVRYSRNFTIEKKGELSIITVRNPWRESTASFRYLLKPRGHATPPGFADCQVVEVTGAAQHSTVHHLSGLYGPVEGGGYHGGL